MWHIFAHGLRNIHELGRQSNGTHSLTRFWLIYSLKLKLNNLLLPPLLSIGFVQECSVVFRTVFDEGGETRKAYITFLLEKWRVWVRVSRAHEVGHFGFMFFSFVNMLFFDYLLLFTRRWKVAELFIIVVMYWSQQHGRRGQKNWYKKSIKWYRVNLYGGN